MKTKLLSSLAIMAVLAANAATVDVDTSNFSSAYDAASDGDILLLSEGAYGGTLTFPSARTVTLKAADGAEVKFGGVFRANDESISGGGIVLDGLKIDITDSYFINLDKCGDIARIEVKNCDISNIARCFLRTSNANYSLSEISFDNCIISNCGSGGWNFMYPKHKVGKVSVTNSTLYNYINGESFFMPNQTYTDNDFTFVFTNNTVYRWGKSNDRALCKTEGKYSANSTYTFKDNIVYKGGTDAVKPQMLQSNTGSLTATNNLVIDYNGYNLGSGDKNIQDLSIEDMGIAELPFPAPDSGDFTIVSSSPLATASTTGGVLGDPRWLKTVHAAVNLTVTAFPEEGGTVSPANATYETGDAVTATATANYGYRFKEWRDASGNVVSSENPYRFDITAETTLTGIFTAVPTYSLTVAKEGDGAKWGQVNLTPEPVNGIYEEATEVVASVIPNSVTLFLYWEDGSIAPVRSVTMNEDKNLTASFDVVPFIVAWDFPTQEPRGNRPADYAFTTDNTGLLSLYNGDGSSTNWGHSTRTFSGIEHNCPRRYTNYADMSNPRYFEAKFNTAGYTNIRLHFLAGADNGCVHSKQLVQYSTDGSTYQPLATFEPRLNEWVENNITIPDGLGSVFIRWIGDTTSEFMGSAKDGDTEGFYLADIVVYADRESINDTEAPVLLGSSPADGSNTASAKGSFILTFNERVKAGTGDITLNGTTLDGVYGSRTVTLPYKGLEYGTDYTLNIPDGAITDMSGNAFAGIDINFSTMERPVPAKRVFDAVVAADGTGNYTTVQAAIDAVPDNRIAPWIIFIKNGEYEELVTVPESKPFIHLIGQDRDKTIISFWINNGGATDKGWEYSTNNPASATYGKSGVFELRASDFYAENISFIDSYGVETQNGPMGQAMNSRSDRASFNNCAFRSFQDTWYTNIQTPSYRHYINNCFIEGAVDFFYGQGEIYVENTTFNLVRDGSVITAPGHKPGTEYGYVFDRCTVESAYSNHTYGRAWQSEPIAVWLNTTLKTTIKPEGWSTWHIAPKLFAEFNTTDSNGDPVDLTNRRTVYPTDNDGEVTRQAILSAEEAARYTYENVTAGTDDWNPRKYFEEVAAPAMNANTSQLSWDESPYAICYVIIDPDEKVEAFTTETTYTPAKQGTYTIKAVNEYGSLSQPSYIKINTGIASIDTAGQVEKTVYYNAQGISSATPFTGLNIVVEYMYDGSTKTSKKMIK